MSIAPSEKADRRGFHPAPLVATVAGLLLGIGALAQWYSQDVSLPRYCSDPEQTLAHLQRVINETEPAGTDSRRPYLIAAKLLFLLPRESGESTEHYLERVERYLRRSC